MNRVRILTLAVPAVAFALAAATPALAQEDVGGSKDHPLLTRYPNSHIVEYTRNYNALSFQVGVDGGAPKIEEVEGEATVIRYFHNSAEKQPSALQLLRNYQNAVKAINGTLLFERRPSEADGGEVVMRVTQGAKIAWIKVAVDIFSAPAQSYVISIVEVAAMQQVVSANQMLDELNKNGFIALYINFDTGKWDLGADGQAAVREIVSMLKAAPAIRLSIEGHTDNVGTPAANKTLSENRAKSVMAAISAGGIDAGRLTAAGFGQEKPVADNRTDEGRAKNRRVELVKK